MEKLSMCRICLSADTRLQTIFGTHLQDMYEYLTMMLLVTEDKRPSLACTLCCSKLETCYELRRQSLRSEELFTQLLRHKAQVNLQVMPNVHPSMEDVMQTTADVLDNADIKQEDAEDDARDHSGTCSDSEDILSLAVIKEDQSDVTANDAAVEQDDADPYHSALGLHTECDIPLDIVKEEPDDVDTGAPRLAAQKYHNETLLNSLKRTEQTIDKVEERKRETRGDVEDTPVEKNKIMETGDGTDVRLHHDTQNYSTSDHSDAHKEMSENEISANQSVNSSSSNKLTPFLCDTCQKCFTRKDCLVRHIRTHTGEKNYKCNVCKKCFIQKVTLDIHMRTHTGEKPFECSVCNKCFRFNTVLSTHIRTHTGEKPYACNACKKCFRVKGHLNMHIRTHTGEKPHECNVCQKCFSRKNHLVRHMRTHTGEKPYECNVCKKCFSRKTHLVRHMRTHTHTGAKPHECNICKKCFDHKSSLFIHMCTHTNKKPYECDLCKKCFMHKTPLSLHMRTHTAEKPYGLKD